jgi:hypothetical protein
MLIIEGTIDETVAHSDSDGRGDSVPDPAHQVGTLALPTKLDGHETVAH